jgi:hypothetical protein
MYTGPNIITDGLVLALDAANTKSYISGSATWNDLSGNNNSGSLVNGPTFNNNGGSVIFNSTSSQYINLGPILNYTSENFTFSYWINFNTLTTNSSGQGPIVFYKGDYQTNGYYNQINTGGGITFVTNQSGASQNSYTNSIISTGSWYNIAYVRNGASVRIYVNGIDRTSFTATHIDPTSNGNNFNIARYPGIYGNFNLSNFLNYNRTLTAPEILQNYNGQKSRFGL